MLNRKPFLAKLSWLWVWAEQLDAYKKTLILHSHLASSKIFLLIYKFQLFLSFMAWGCSTSDNASEKCRKMWNATFERRLLVSSGPPAKGFLHVYTACVYKSYTSSALLHSSCSLPWLWSIGHPEQWLYPLTSAGWGMSQKRGETRLLVKLCWYSCVGVTVQSSG